MTRQEALDFLKENTLTNLRLALLEPDSNKAYIQALIRIVEGDKFVVLPALKFVDRQGGEHCMQPETTRLRFIATASGFGLCLELSGDHGIIKDVASDNWVAAVKRWGWEP